MNHAQSRRSARFGDVGRARRRVEIEAEGEAADNDRVGGDQNDGLVALKGSGGGRSVFSWQKSLNPGSTPGPLPSHSIWLCNGLMVSTKTNIIAARLQIERTDSPSDKRNVCPLAMLRYRR